MRNNVPKLMPLWGPALHQDPPYARTTLHNAHVFFCHDVAEENLPASIVFNKDWLVTENLELLSSTVFEAKLITSPVGANNIPELATNNEEDHYVAQAAVLPACLVRDLLELPHNPVAAWCLLCVCAATLGLLEHCASLWLLLRAATSPVHREDSAVLLALADENAHFVSTCRSVLEAVLPALDSGSPAPLPAPFGGGAVGTPLLAWAIEAATQPAAQKVVTVEEKWPHLYGCLLIMVGVPGVDALHNFWHDYGWAYVQWATSAMAKNLGLEAPTIVAKTVEVLDSLVMAGASKDSLSEGLTIWQFPALAPANTYFVNGKEVYDPGKGSSLGTPPCPWPTSRRPCKWGRWEPPRAGCTPAPRLSIGRLSW
jgi:hypothetical protein